jgi:uncharacterized cysteine cluster protein YcgN (CxxCxxCC family)/cytochrome oxidase Cu insertion factor (SCO1/SenC/PrrC family)
LLSLGGCQREASAPPLQGATIGGPFSLVNQDGQRVTERDFAGRYRLMYFGFANCPDICPVDLQVIGGGLRQFERDDPERAQRVQPIFVTVDPARDTPPLLKRYVAAFHPRLVGLTGSQAEIEAAKRAFGIFGEAADGSAGRADRDRAARPGAGRNRRRARSLGGMRERFWELPVDDLTREEWEALCDGCGKCCLHKLEDSVTGEVHPTNVACKLLDRRSGKCSDYKMRRMHVPECVRLTVDGLRKIDWLPVTCAYRLRGDNKPLAEWHYLISGDPESVHKAGISVRGWTVAEQDVGDIEQHVVDREL